MPFPSQAELIAAAAVAGFHVGDYVHMATRDFHTAAPIREFTMVDNELIAVWMGGACRSRLSELRRSTGHRTRVQFGQDYEFFLSPALIAQVVQQAGGTTAGGPYQAVYVQGFGTPQVDAWGTTTEPGAEHAVFVRIAPASPTPPAATDLSPGIQLIAGIQLITVGDVGHQLKVKPKKAQELFKQMQREYGPQPTFINLAIFSGETDLIEMIKRLRALRPASGR